MRTLTMSALLLVAMVGLTFRTVDAAPGEGTAENPLQCTLLDQWNLHVLVYSEQPDTTFYLVPISVGSISIYQNGRYINWKQEAADEEMLGASGPYAADSDEIAFATNNVGLNCAAIITNVRGAYQDATGIGYKQDSQNRDRYITFTVHSIAVAP